jgi:hypothetical protein
MRPAERKASIAMQGAVTRQSRLNARWDLIVILQVLEQLGDVVEFTVDELAQLHRKFNDNSQDGLCSRADFDKVAHAA